jgi:hypothetical protein
MRAPVRADRYDRDDDLTQASGSFEKLCSYSSGKWRDTADGESSLFREESQNNFGALHGSLDRGPMANSRKMHNLLSPEPFGVL